MLMDANMKDDCRRSKLIRVLLSWTTLDDLKRSHSCFKEIPLLKCQKQEQFGCLSERLDEADLSLDFQIVSDGFFSDHKVSHACDWFHALFSDLAGSKTVDRC